MLEMALTFGKFDLQLVDVQLVLIDLAYQYVGLLLAHCKDFSADFLECHWRGCHSLQP